MIQRIRARENSSNRVPSMAAKPSWKLLASGRIGRKSTVSTAYGARPIDVATDGTKFDPPIDVFWPTVLSEEFTSDGLSPASRRKALLRLMMMRATAATE